VYVTLNVVVINKTVTYGNKSEALKKLNRIMSGLLSLCGNIETTRGMRFMFLN